MDRVNIHLLRDLAPLALGALVRRYRDFSAAEDAVQEALLAAATQWPVQGVPDNPLGWVVQVGRRRMTDWVRAEAARRRREELDAERSPEELLVPAFDSEIEPERDDTLDLLFMCCHPELTRSSAIALTLRAVGGLTTAEIANAFLVPEATMAQRISRAKQTIQQAGARFNAPSTAERSQRLATVLHVLYLVFNEGYSTSVGSALQRVDLSAEAIRLTRAVVALVTDDAEARGLLALMLLTDARRVARSGPHGEIVPLDEQDRSSWDRAQIEEGIKLVEQALSRGAVGPYQLQAAIAALHDQAPSHDQTDWEQIRALYGLLLKMSDNPMIALNHAIAVAMVEGPAAGLRLLEELGKDRRLATHHRLAAVRGHLHERQGDDAQAIVQYQLAAERTASLPERNYLQLKVSRLRTKSLASE